MKNAFLYPGQGAQKVGMGIDAANSTAIGKARFEEASDILGWDLKSLVENGPDDVLGQTDKTQPALFTVSAIFSDLLNEKGLIPSVTMGHSLGEYSALYGAKVFSFADGVKLVSKRGSLMAEAGKSAPGTMAAIIGLEKPSIASVLEGVTSGMVVCANENTPLQTVISGEVSAVEEACEKLKETGAKRAIILKVSGAFHSPLMSTAAELFRETLDSIAFNNPQCPVITNVTASTCIDGNALKGLLIDQLLSPVRWVESERALLEMGVERYCEVGPGKVLKGLMRDVDKSISVLSCGTLDDIAEIS